MTIPKWKEGLDDHGIHRQIRDNTLSEALPHAKADSITGYHEKYVDESKGKLVVQGKDKKMRRTALGEGLFKDQQRLKDAVRKFNGARRMKRVADTKARVWNAPGHMFPVADGPSPQNINPIRRTVIVQDLDLNTTRPTTDLKRIEVPAHVMRPVDGDNKFLATVSDGDEPSNDINEKNKTLCFVSHGCVKLSCEAVLRDDMKIGDRVYVAAHKNKFGTKTMTSDYPDQYKIGSANNDESYYIGIYLGPASSRPDGGIYVRLDLT